MEQKTKRIIERTLLPNLNTNSARLNATDMQYFYKIKRNLKLQDWQKERDSPVAKNKSAKNTHRFNISPRLKELSQHRPSLLQTIDASRKEQNKSLYVGVGNKKQHNFTSNYFNQNHFFFIKEDGLEYTDEDNIGKNINGTKLGIFSEQVISQKLQDSRQKQPHKIPNAPSLTRQLDSDSEAVEQQPPQLKQVSKKVRKLSLISKNSSKAQTNRVENRLLDVIYGDEQFLQKYKTQQMSLMEKNSVYRQKKLTLDYKNEWKI